MNVSITPEQARAVVAAAKAGRDLEYIDQAALGEGVAALERATNDEEKPSA